MPTITLSSNANAQNSGNGVRFAGDTILGASVATGTADPTLRLMLNSFDSSDTSLVSLNPNAVVAAKEGGAWGSIAVKVTPELLAEIVSVTGTDAVINSASIHLRWESTDPVFVAGDLISMHKSTKPIEPSEATYLQASVGNLWTGGAGSAAGDIGDLLGQTALTQSMIDNASTIDEEYISIPITGYIADIIADSNTNNGMLVRMPIVGNPWDYTYPTVTGDNTTIELGPAGSIGACPEITIDWSAGGPAQTHTFTSGVLHNNANTVLATTAVNYSWFEGGRIGSFTGITPLEGTDTTDANGNLAVVTPNANAGLLLVSEPVTDATDDGVYYEAGTPVTT